MHTLNHIKEHGIQSLERDFAIKVKEYPEGLFVLNYDQINSPKSHPIVMECRGLIIDADFNVVCRSFDRFFNLGEAPETQSHIDMTKAVCFDKVDGSLVRIYYWGGKWNVATRGTAFAETTVNGFDVTFRQLVDRAIGDKIENIEARFDKDVTYTFEFTSMENRVVTRYTGYTLHFLAARNNKTGEFVYGRDQAASIGAIFPNEYRFDSTAACAETASQLKDLKEGYVLYQDGIPVCKIKSPAYCAVHLLRGEGLNPKRISELVLTGEQDEYIAYFPEDAEYIRPYVKALELTLSAICAVWYKNKNIESQKDFALAVKGYPYSSVLFYLRKNMADHINHPEDVIVRNAWEAQTVSYRAKFLMDTVV